MKSLEIKELAQKYFKKRDDNTSKLDYGRSLIIGGSYKYAGAPKFSCLALEKLLSQTTATMLVGTGISFIALPGVLAKYALNYVEYSGVIKLPTKFGNIKFSNRVNKKITYGVNSIAIGMGINKVNSINFIEYVLDKTTANMVIDADAITDTLNFDLKNRVILTPNVREFQRLTGNDGTKENAKEFADKHNCVVILKGHNSYVTDGKEEYINQTGNAKLAKGGSGDILSGIICGLLAIGVPIFEAGVLGSYILGRCAELCEVNEYSALPKDIIEKIVDVVGELVNF